MTANDAVSAAVTYHLGQQGLSKAELARRLGCGAGTLSNKLSGRRRWHVDELDELAVALGVRVQSLLAESFTRPYRRVVRVLLAGKTRVAA